MSRALPERPDLNWLRKRSKRALAELRRSRPEAKLAEAQLAVAREHGFSSWRALERRVRELQKRVPADVPRAVVAGFLERVGVGDLAAVRTMLEEVPGLVNAAGPHPFWGGQPQPLHVAIDTHRDDMVALLLAAGADVDGDNAGYSHWSPLLLAIEKKRHRAKRALLRRGARVGLVEALAMGDDATALRLLARGRAALPEHVPGGGSVLMYARTPAAIDRLLALGVATDAHDTWGADPVEALSRRGKAGAALVHHIARQGVPVDAEAYARVGDRRTLARLVAADPAIATRPTVLKAAVDFGHRSLTKWLLARGADPNARSLAKSRDTCLHSAAWNGDSAMVELLLAHGADPTLLDEEHEGTPAQWARVATDVTANPACAPLAERLEQAIEEHEKRA